MFTRDPLFSAVALPEPGCCCGGVGFAAVIRVRFVRVNTTRRARTTAVPSPA